MKISEPLRADLGGERVRDIQAYDDSEELGTSAAGAEHDRTEVRTHAGFVNLRERRIARRRVGHGRTAAVGNVPFRHLGLSI